MTFEELEQKVIEWAVDKGIMDKSDPKSQLLKTVSEIGELADAVNQDDMEELIDAVGDTLVTLIILCKMKNVEITNCLNSAYSVIANRTGSMQNGVFVKDEC